MAREPSERELAQLKELLRRSGGKKQLRRWVNIAAAEVDKSAVGHPRYDDMDITLILIADAVFRLSDEADLADVDLKVAWPFWKTGPDLDMSDLIKKPFHRGAIKQGDARIYLPLPPRSTPITPRKAISIAVHRHYHLGLLSTERAWVERLLLKARTQDCLAPLALVKILNSKPKNLTVRKPPKNR